jgi:methylmalonyl-CoA mutase cobalamin-binding subunit
MPGESRLRFLSVTSSSPEPFQLPRRTGRSLRPGRHRSPHRLTLPSDAPALILAVPGPASARSAEIVSGVAAVARQSCQGAEIRIGYLEGSADTLAEALVFDSAPSAVTDLQGVVVPLLTAPLHAVDVAIETVTSRAAASLLLAGHLGPHPLLAEALHTRLAEAGLARQARARGLSIAPTANGVVVVAHDSADALKDAGVAAVLLAGRLAAPALNAALDDRAGIEAAVRRLREAGVGQTAIAPCIIGPETDPAELTELADAIGAPCAPMLGAHTAIGQLVAMRYGAALADLRLANSPS